MGPSPGMPSVTPPKSIKSPAPPKLDILPSTRMLRKFEKMFKIKVSKEKDRTSWFLGKIAIHLVFTTFLGGK